MPKAQAVKWLLTWNALHRVCGFNPRPVHAGQEKERDKEGEKTVDRRELEKELRELYVAHQETSAFPYMHRECQWCDSRMSKVMALVDAYVETLDTVPMELWTAAEVAAHLGVKTEAQARTMMSRWGIKKAGQREHPDSGRTLALYPADVVRYCFDKEKEKWRSARNSVPGRRRDASGRYRA